MATANHVLLQRIALTATAASVTFDSIPQTGYTDLKIVYSARTNRASYQADGVSLIINGLTTGLTFRNLYGQSSAAGSVTDTIIYGGAAADIATANTFSNVELYISNYRSSNFKSISIDAAQEHNGGANTAWMSISGGLWSSTSAITSFGFQSSTGASFVAGSSFSLYGIADAATTPVSAPKADGGDIIRTDGTYWYHAFLSSGRFKPQVNLTADILQVAGGGGGGHNAGGGGGAGGLLVFTSQALSTQEYVCTIGAGGAPSPGNGATGYSGSASQLGTLTASAGGGGGGGIFLYNGLSGGSGGGGASGYESATGGTGGAASPSGQGYAGGNGQNGLGTAGTNWGGGGGGGAGGAGSAGTTSAAGNGGVGLYSAFTDAIGAATGLGQLVSTHYYFAGGGAGGKGVVSSASGGSGGGGSSASNSNSGTANTGGGGAGANNGSPGGVGGTGGSGIIIIRYSVA